MDGFLNLWVKGAHDQVAKNWVAKALVIAFPDPLVSHELTHARAVLAPIHDRLAARATRCLGTQVVMHGRVEDEPLLALAERSAALNFHEDSGRETRIQLFRLLVELVAYDPRVVKLNALKEFARALRLELQALATNPTGKADVPHFRSAWDVLAWFGQQEARYTSRVIGAWRTTLESRLRQALLNPAPAPASFPELEDAGGGVVLVPPAWTDTELLEGARPYVPPPTVWLDAEEASHTRSTWDDRLTKSVIGASISTYIPLGRFTPASPTYLPDEEAASEAHRLIVGARGAREAGDADGHSQLVARALSLASSTPIKHLEALIWGEPGPDSLRRFPGILARSGRWMYRPELSPQEQGLGRSSWIHIPLPAALGAELLALEADPDDPGRVFRKRDVPLGGSGRIRSSTRITHTHLQRALTSRLIDDPQWGPTLAQLVAGDDLGMDVAPLHYDRPNAADVVVKISSVTFPWFGERAGTIEGGLPRHWVGSNRVTEAKRVAAALADSRKAWADAPRTLAAWINHRTYNLVAGLLLSTGHRPNDHIGQLTRKDIGDEDGIAILRDKVAGPDWTLRPVALAARWIEEYRWLLSDLASAAGRHGGTELERACEDALSGDGPIFLVIDDALTARPFSLADYLARLPDDLCEIPNFARQFLNNELAKLLPEHLRVAQMGWHGTREGAFADGSGWSVLGACAQIAPKLDHVLKSVGWRPLGENSKGELRAVGPVSWRAAEREHRADFKRRIRNLVRAAAARRMALVPELEQQLAALLDHSPLGLAGALKLKDGALDVSVHTSAPLKLPDEWSRDAIRLLSKGDLRSLQAHAAREWLRSLIIDAREKGILLGPIPRRSHDRWPDSPGPFIKYAAIAPTVARRIDRLVSESDASRALKTIVTLLLHGGYADITAALAAMDRNTALSRLDSDGSILLAEPKTDGDGTVEELPDSAWMRGTMAFHHLAAVALWNWHQRKDELPPLGELESELEALVKEELSTAGAKRDAFPWLREIEALARTLNSVRMDGVAKLVGTGAAKPACAALQRVVDRRDGLPLGARSSAAGSLLSLAVNRGSPERVDRAHSLIDRLTKEIQRAVQKASEDRRKEAAARDRLEKTLRTWLGMAAEYRIEELLVLYTLLLLTRGGRRRPRLELVTIQGYVYAVARPLSDVLPEKPMAADSDDWTLAFKAALAKVDARQRPGRAAALANFHWVLAQAMSVPDVDIGEIFAFAGRTTYLADAGFLTDAELLSLAYVLRAGVEQVMSADQDRAHVHAARGNKLAAELMYSGAMRPGEAMKLTYRSLPTVLDGRLAIRRNHFQHLKNANARRCVKLALRGLGVSPEVLQAKTDVADQMLGADFSLALPVFYELENPALRASDLDVLGDLSGLLKWVTADPDARPYWLRKTGVMHRLEHVLGGPRSSNWPMRTFLAEVGHADLRVTLTSYIHDPVVPFSRWFEEPAMPVDSARLAAVVGRVRDARARDAAAADKAPPSRALLARIAHLIADAPYARKTAPAGVVEFPNNLTSQDPRTIAIEPAEVAALLTSVAKGMPLAAAATTCHWPVGPTARLEVALDELRDTYGIDVVGTPGEAAKGRVPLSPPRNLDNDGGLPALLDDPDACAVLAKLFDAWVEGVSWGLSPAKVAASPREWAEWGAAVPQLAGLPWEDTHQASARRVRMLKPAEKGSVGLWPTLRWVMACAWLSKRLIA